MHSGSWLLSCFFLREVLILSIGVPVARYRFAFLGLVFIRFDFAASCSEQCFLRP